jgi:hypothetical protein
VISTRLDPEGARINAINDQICSPLKKPFKRDMLFFVVSCLTKCQNRNIVRANKYIHTYLIKNVTKHTGCPTSPRVAKKLHNLFVIKGINFFFFLNDSYASTAYSENIAVYIQGVPIL